MTFGDLLQQNFHVLHRLLGMLCILSAVFCTSEKSFWAEIAPYIPRKRKKNHEPKMDGLFYHLLASLRWWIFFFIQQKCQGSWWKIPHRTWLLPPIASACCLGRGLVGNVLCATNFPLRAKKVRSMVVVTFNFSGLRNVHFLVQFGMTELASNISCQYILHSTLW